MLLAIHLFNPPVLCSPNHGELHPSAKDPWAPGYLGGGVRGAPPHPWRKRPRRGKQAGRLQGSQVQCTVSQELEADAHG